MSRPPLGRPPANVSKEQKKNKKDKQMNLRGFVIVLRESLARGKEDLA
ncbi:hypothetical protein RintRC_0322 [Richelia intracellularis]|nr:hypothetical protein RintRC_0322 [Richelia intracellularis]